MRSVVGVLIVAAGLAAAGEGGAQTYAIASVLGHQLSVAFNHETVHSRIASNVKVIPVADAVFDNAAIGVVKKLLRKTDPKRKLIELGVSDPVIVAAAKMAPQLDTAEFRAIVDPLVAIVRPAGAERLILIVPHRHELVIRRSTGPPSASARAAASVSTSTAAPGRRAPTRSRSGTGFSASTPTSGSLSSTRTAGG